MEIYCDVRRIGLYIYVNEDIGICRYMYAEIYIGRYTFLFSFEWGFYALSASKVIFRARTLRLYNLFSPVMMIT